MRQQILANFPGAKFFANLMARNNLRQEVPCTELWGAGFPCQPNISAWVAKQGEEGACTFLSSSIGTMHTVPALTHGYCTSLKKKHATRPHTRNIAFYFKPYVHRLYLHIGLVRDELDAPGVGFLEILRGTQPQGGSERVSESNFHCSLPCPFLIFFLIFFCFNPRPLASACQVLPTAACGLPSSSPASACQAICNAFLQHSYTNKGCKKQVTGIIDLQHAGCPGTPALLCESFEGEVY